MDPNCDLNSIVLDAFDNARFLCDQYYLMSPELIIEQHNGQNPEVPISIIYVPSHLYHMLFELFKNSLRAVVETHGDSGSLPPIKIILTKGEEDVSIKISGIYLRNANLCFHNNLLHSITFDYRSRWRH